MLPFAREATFFNVSATNLSEVFVTDPEIMGGTPVFTGTRVPVQNLIDYLEGGETIDEFRAGFPTVKREQVIAFIEAAAEKLLAPT
ncbi:conserved hypothetical protein [Verrucomicrobia bacterium]|nr:conserved hypothetical protein [Verrucomicrobiota bacterium]